MQEPYKGRSRLFTPKTRAMVTKNEAIGAEAFFSTNDVASLRAFDDADQVSSLACDILGPVLQHHLKHSIPWFLTCMGAWQEAQVAGHVISYQSWHYDEKLGIDRPEIRLVPTENFRLSPAADWTRPIESSPYLIELIPMYLGDVMRRMRAPSEPNSPAWKQVDEKTLKTAITSYGDSTRILREGQRSDSKSSMYNSTNSFSLVWVHRNIIRGDDGTDWMFYSLGDKESTIVLSDPIESLKVHAHGRPYVIGISAIEAHKLYADGPVWQTRDLQAEGNEIVNNRIDNVKFAMNKRYFVARNRQVDLRSLTRNVPASVTMMNDIEKDVRIVDTPDVTGSSYQEQDRINLAFDDIAGTFSTSSVQSNRKLNETVGGMNLITANSNQIAAYRLRTFVETWATPVLAQVVEMIKAYEDNPERLMMSPEARSFANMGGQFQQLFARKIATTVNIGMTATSPKDQVQNFISVLSEIRALLADGSLEQRGLQVHEVIKEVLGKIGYSDGSRFFQTPGQNQDPTVTMLMNKVQALQSALDAKHPPELIQAQVEKLKEEAKALRAKVVDTNVSATFAAIQTGEVIAAVPDVAPIADKVLEAAGFQQDAGGVDPNLPQPQSPAAGLAVQDVMNKRTGVGFTPGNTHPTFPANPQSPDVGATAGMQTQQPDSTQ